MRCSSGFQACVLNSIWIVFAPEVLQESSILKWCPGKATFAITAKAIMFYNSESLEKIYIFIGQTSHWAKEKGSGFF